MDENQTPAPAAADEQQQNLIARRGFTYAGKWLNPGDPFVPKTPAHARLLRAVGRVGDAPIVAGPDDGGGGGSGAYKTRVLTAEQPARAAAPAAATAAPASTAVPGSTTKGKAR